MLARTPCMFLRAVLCTSLCFAGCNGEHIPKHVLCTIVVSYCIYRLDNIYIYIYIYIYCFRCAHSSRLNHIVVYLTMCQYIILQYAIFYLHYVILQYSIFCFHCVISDYLTCYKRLNQVYSNSIILVVPHKAVAEVSQ